MKPPMALTIGGQMKFLLISIFSLISVSSFAKYTQIVSDTGSSVEHAISRLEWSLDKDLREVCVFDTTQKLPNNQYTVYYKCTLENHCEILDVADIQAMGRPEYVLLCRN